MNNQANMTVSQATEFKRAFDYFNKALFGKKLGDVMLSFKAAKSGKSTGHTVYQAWENEQGERGNQINLDPVLFQGELETLFAELVKQMNVHDFMTNKFPLLPKGRIEQGKALTYTNQDMADSLKGLGLRPYLTDKEGNEVKEKETGQGVQVAIIPGGSFDQAFQDMPEDIKFPWTALPDFVQTKKEDGEKKVGRVKYSGKHKEETLNVWAKPGEEVAVKRGGKWVALTEENKEVSEDRIELAA